MPALKVYAPESHPKGIEEPSFLAVVTWLTYAPLTSPTTAVLSVRYQVSDPDQAFHTGSQLSTTRPFS